MKGKTGSKEAENLLADVPEDQTFRCCDGNVLRNTRELRDALLTMSNATYAFHAGDGKQEFSNWVKNVIKDARLAVSLSKAESRLHAGKITADHVVFLNNLLPGGG